MVTPEIYLKELLDLQAQAGPEETFITPNEANSLLSQIAKEKSSNAFNISYRAPNTPSIQESMSKPLSNLDALQKEKAGQREFIKGAISIAGPAAGTFIAGLPGTFVGSEASQLVNDQLIGPLYGDKKSPLLNTLGWGTVNAAINTGLGAAGGALTNAASRTAGLTKLGQKFGAKYFPPLSEEGKAIAAAASRQGVDLTGPQIEPSIATKFKSETSPIELRNAVSNQSNQLENAITATKKQFGVKSDAEINNLLQQTGASQDKILQGYKTIRDTLFAGVKQALGNRSISAQSIKDTISSLRKEAAKDITGQTAKAIEPVIAQIEANIPKNNTLKGANFLATNKGLNEAIDNSLSKFDKPTNATRLLGKLKDQFRDLETQLADKAGPEVATQLSEARGYVAKNAPIYEGKLAQSLKNTIETKPETFVNTFTKSPSVIKDFEKIAGAEGMQALKESYKRSLFDKISGISKGEEVFNPNAVLKSLTDNKQIAEQLLGKDVYQQLSSQLSDLAKIKGSIGNASVNAGENLAKKINPGPSKEEQFIAGATGLVGAGIGGHLGGAAGAAAGGGLGFGMPFLIRNLLVKHGGRQLEGLFKPNVLDINPATLLKMSGNIPVQHTRFGQGLFASGNPFAQYLINNKE